MLLDQAQSKKCSITECASIDRRFQYCEDQDINDLNISSFVNHLSSTFCDTSFEFIKY